jgi:tRNA pseudouridine38-40 synthase
MSKTSKLLPIDSSSELKKIRLLISYDGTDYCGWQKQKDHAHASEKPSIQGTMEEALSKLFNEPISLNASGRTDAGVHALGQVGDFQTTRPLPKDLCWALRSLLPDSIVIKKAWVAPLSFHSTLSSVRKTYRYWIWNDLRQSALLSRYSYWLRFPLDLEYLNSQAQYLVGEHDFKSFQCVGTPVQTTVRKIYSIRWQRRNSRLVQFEVTGNGFLKQMVRNIVGTQVDLCVKAQPIEKIDEIIKIKDRSEGGATAAPQGLYLRKVYYPRSLDNQCREI